MTVEVSDDSDMLAARVRRRDLPRTFWLLVVARAVNRLGAFTLAFLTVVLVDELGASLTEAGLVVSAFGAATIPSRLAGGWLADRIGRVPTICLGLVGCAIGQTWVALSPTLPVALVGAVLLGLAFELYEPPSQALVADLTDDRQRPVAYGLLAAALAVAGAAAGLLAVWLGGTDLRLLLLVDAATCLVTAVLVAALVRDPPADGTAGAVADGAVTGASPWRDPRLLAMLASGTAFALLYLVLIIALPLTMVERGLPAERAGWVLCVSALTIVAAQPLLARRLLAGDAFTAMTLGYLVLAVGLAATGLATSVLGFALAALVWSVGDLLLLGHAMTIVSRLAPADSRGAYLAAYGLSWGVATVLAPVVGTGLLRAGGPVLLWGSLATLALALSAVQPALARCCRAPSKLASCALPRSRP